MFGCFYFHCHLIGTVYLHTLCFVPCFKNQLCLVLGYFDMKIKINNAHNYSSIQFFTCNQFDFAIFLSYSGVITICYYLETVTFGNGCLNVDLLWIVHSPILSLFITDKLSEILLSLLDIFSAFSLFLSICFWGSLQLFALPHCPLRRSSLTFLDGSSKTFHGKKLPYPNLPQEYVKSIFYSS